MQELKREDPRQLGDYTLTGLLGRGRLWRTFKASKPNGELAAVKLVHDDLARDPDFVAEFTQAATRARTVDSPHLVKVTDSGVSVGRPWLATEFVDGQSLTDLQNRLSFLTCHTLTTNLVEGLLEIHEAGIVHGAIKPSNILWKYPGYKLGDFGFSHLGVNSPAAASPEEWFLSPEQAAGMPAQPASDVFGLAAVLVFAVTGQGPARPGAPASPPPGEFVQALAESGHHGFPASIWPTVAKCLGEDPGKRPALADLLDRITEAIDTHYRALAADAERERANAASEENATVLLGGGHVAADLVAPAGTGSYEAALLEDDLGRGVPVGRRDDPLPHDGLFIRRNNGFGTKSTLGIADLIEQGVLIDQERIRFDDFVAGRGDDIPPPDAGDAVAVRHGLAPAPPGCRASEQATHFLEIALRAGDSPGASPAVSAPLAANFVFVVDTSSSMYGDKIATAKGAIRGLYDQMRDDDVIGIVSFDTDVRTVLRARRKGDLPPAEFIDAVEGLAAHGATDLNMGVQFGIQEIRRHAGGRSGTVDCVYLFSDGDPTSGERNWIQIRSNIAAELRGDLTLSCFGFGSDARMRELEALAGLTGGHCTLVTQPDDVRLSLTADLARREHLAAVNIQLKIDISPDAGIWHLYGHDLVTDPATRAAVLRDAAEARQRGREQFGAESLPDLITDERGIRIFAPDLAFGETYWIVFELALPEGMNPGDMDGGGLGTATVQYVDAAARDSRRREITLGAPGGLPEPVVAGHAIGLWTSEVTFYALDDLYERDRRTAKERITRHIKILRTVAQHIPAPWLADDQVVLGKFASLTDNLDRPRSWDDSPAGAAPMRFAMHSMNSFAQVRAGYDRRSF